MNRRLLTILLTAVFAAQAAGLTGALHLATEHCTCCGHEHSDVECNAANESAAGIQDDCGSHKTPHDPAHSAICQVLATFTPMHIPQPPMVVRLESLRIVRPSVDPAYLFAGCIGTLGPRAPPACLLRTSV